MEKLFGWLTKKDAMTFLCFVLGALLLLIGVTTSIEIPGLQRLAPDANSRLVSLVLGGIFIALAFVFYFVSPKRTAQNWITQIEPKKLPGEDEDAAARTFRYGKGARKYSMYVFPRPYAAKPDAVVALTKIDLQDQGAHIHRIGVIAEDVEPQGFMLLFTADHESIVYDAVALDRRRPGRVKLSVQTYARYKGDERPVRFRLDDREYLVEEIMDQWYGPGDTFFKVRADDRNVFILRRRETAEWVLV